MKPLLRYGAVFLSGTLVGWAALPSLSGWDLLLVRNQAADQATVNQTAVAASQPQKLPAPEIAALVEPNSAQASFETKTGGASEWRAGAGHDNPDEPPAFAPPPHLSEAEFESLFEQQDRLDERIASLESMIAAMERDGLPEDHIAFMKQALLAEESSDDGAFDSFFDEPEPSFEEREADIVQSYGEAGASPEEIEEMLEVMQDGLESQQNSSAAEWDLHTPPAPLE